MLALMMLVSCKNEALPVQAQTFIDQYFPQSSIVLVDVEIDEGVKEYSVWLNDGTKIEFDMQGNWRRVGRNKTGVPASLIPDAINQYVRTHYPNDVVTKFSKKDYGYKLELSDDMDLRFNHQCQFMEVVD
jgi:hypothetical protein